MPVNNGMPMMPGMPGMPGMPVNGSMPSMNYSSMGMMNTSTGPSSPNKTEKSENAPSAPAATSTPMSPNASNLSVDSQMAYQHAFLQNAVAQNMQIQQQLMMQNQALSQLLSQTSNVNISTTSQPKSSMSPKENFSPTQTQSTRSIKQPVPVYFGMNEAQRRASETQLNSNNQNGPLDTKPRSKTAPNTPKNSTNLPPQAPMLPSSGGPMDAYTRARTVRIGKWRWPPPKEDGEALAEGFFEFKMRKMKHKDDGFDITDAKNESLETSGEIQGLDWSDMNEDFNKGLKRSQSKDSFTIMDDNGQPREKSESPAKERGALDISKEGDIPDQAVKKLNENRKLILEQKLGGGGKLKKWENIDNELHHRATEENDSSRKSSHDNKGHIPAPPPPPIAPSFTKPLHVDTDQRGSPSPGSSYYSPGGSTPVIPDSRKPPPPVAPVVNGDIVDGYRRKNDRERRESVSTHQTEKTERYELEESSEFLQPMDDHDRRAQNILDELDYQAMEEMQTRLHPPNSNMHFSYNRVPWKLKVRKEVFSPSEQLTNPTTIHVVFCQIVFDTFSPLCIRLTQSERRKMMGYMDKYDIDPKNVHSSQHKNSTKVNIISMAKDFSTYFSRIYPVASNDQDVDLQYLAVSHTGVKLIRREKSLPTDYLKVVDFYNFEDIASVETVKSSALQLVMHTGGRVVVTTSKAASIRDLISQFSIEARSGQYEYARALADYSSREENALNFKAGDIVAVVPKEDAYTARGWLYGIKDGNYGVFPADYVDKMSPKSIRKEIKVISRITQSSPRQRASQTALNNITSESPEDGHPAASPIGEDYSPGGTWNLRNNRDSYEAGDTSDVSISAAKVSNDGKHPLLEFAMSYFRESNNFDAIPQDGSIKDKKKKKKKNSKNDWTWKDQVELVKWTERMIENSLMRLEQLEMNKVALECFASIMRYMGDMALMKNQLDVDCALTILSYCYKFDDMKDEVYCQIMKQTTNNKSAVPDSCQKGWRLFSIIAAYFTCSDHLKPFLFKYLETAAYDKRRAYHGTALVCLHNLRKTFKYGGRKMAPSIEEITAITAGRNSKRQIYRLPGGTERVINTKSTTVVDDIVEELCTVIGVTSPHEREEFSLYCIIEGQTFTRPLYKEQYILDVPPIYRSRVRSTI